MEPAARDPFRQPGRAREARRAAEQDIDPECPADEDGDGIPNYLDPANSDPCVPNASAPACEPDDNDSDNDGLSDPSELYHDTAKFSNDTDQDGLSDGEEVNGFWVNQSQYRTDPHDPDMDDDGALDGEERNWGWNPTMTK
jgi:hypothetical protein